MRSQFGNFVLNSPSRVLMPVGVYAGLEITGASVREVVTNPKSQVKAILALHQEFNTQVLVTAMDLSAEAEIFGCQIRMDEDEIPTVIGRRVKNINEIDQLEIPSAGAGRTAVHLEAAHKTVHLSNGHPVLGGLIGPFSLAARLFGVSEALELSITDPTILEKLLCKATEFLIQYVQAFRSIGAAGVIMAEPAAGLLSPMSLGRFSSDFIQNIVEVSQSEQFSIIVHNCGAKLAHLPNIVSSGAEIFHFGGPMKIVDALRQVDANVILAGNLNPTSVFFYGTPADVESQTRILLNQTGEFKNFILSPGCDIPPHTPIENLEAFFACAG